MWGLRGSFLGFHGFKELILEGGKDLPRLSVSSGDPAVFGANDACLGRLWTVRRSSQGFFGGKGELG